MSEDNAVVYESRDDVNEYLARLAVSRSGAAAKSTGFDLIRPIDGVTDDWPTLIPRITTNAAIGITSILAPGIAGQHFICETPGLIWPSFSTVLGTPETGVDVNLPNTFGGDIAIFHQIAVTFPSTLITADTVVGSRTLHITAPLFTNGERILIVGNGVSASQAGSTYRVVAGGGTTTLTLDRPFQFPWRVANGINAVLVASQPTGIYIDGRGMTMRGPALGMMYFTGALDCHISNITYDALGATGVLVGFDFDVYCVGCTATNLTVKNASGVNLPFSTWGNESTVFTNCVVDGTSQEGFVIIDSALVDLVNCETTGSQEAGAAFTNSYGATLGTACTSCRVIGGAYNGSSTNGVEVSEYNRNTFIGGGVQCIGNQTGIAVVLVVGGSIYGTTIDGVACDENSIEGIGIGPGNVGAIIGSASTSGNGYGIVAGSQCIIADHTTSGKNTFADLQCEHTTGLVSVAGFDYTTDGAGASSVILTAAGRTSMQGGIVRHSAATRGVELLAGVLVLSDSTIEGNAAGQGFLFTAATLRLGNGFRASGYNAGNLFVCFTSGWISPSITDLASTAPANMFGFTGNGATPVVVPFPDLTAEDSIHTERIGGTSTAAGDPVIVKTPGTGYTWTWAGGAAGVYNARVEG